MQNYSSKLKTLVAIFIFLSFLGLVWFGIYRFQKTLREGEWADYVERGNEMVTQKHYAEALELYQKAYQTNQNLPPSAQAGLGEVYFAAGDISRAQEQLEQALAKDASLETAQKLLVAIQLSQETINSNQTITQKINLAYEFLQKDQPFLAIPILEKIVNDAPSYRDGHYLLAAAYLKIGGLEKARQQIEKTLEIDPNFEAGEKLKEKIGF